MYRKVLDPRFKLDYFQKARWPADKVNAMKQQITDLWTSLYESVRLMRNETQFESSSSLLLKCCSLYVLAIEAIRYYSSKYNYD